MWHNTEELILFLRKSKYYSWARREADRALSYFMSGEIDDPVDYFKKSISEGLCEPLYEVLPVSFVEKVEDLLDAVDWNEVLESFLPELHISDWESYKRGNYGRKRRL